MTTLTPEEVKRYNRHLVLQEFGMQAQVKLKNAKVLVVGAGGLGSPALLYLAASGIGTIGIVDFDVVSISNLQRQVLFTTDDLNKNKADIACLRLQKLNPLITLKSYPLKLTAKQSLEIVSDYDVVLDAIDNFQARYLLNDTCVILNKPLVYGSILKFEGHASVFNFRNEQGVYSSNYRDLFPEPPEPQSVPDCEEAGVLGVLPGIIGSIQANEVIKILAGIGEPLADKLLIFDSLTLQQNLIRVQNRNSREGIKTLIDYEDFCGISQDKNKYLGDNQKSIMKEVTVQELKKLKESGADFQLIDVREPHEYDICNLDGELIPMSEIPHNVDKISKDKQVVIHCRSGKRSGDMLLWLEKNHGFTNLYNLKGGVLAWAKEIDPEMPVY
jgi:molybdopterin/thiamine biosynthesis adenylyltransferase/rhodanese-related sulfurtransferase